MAAEKLKSALSTPSADRGSARDLIASLADERAATGAKIDDVLHAVIVAPAFLAATNLPLVEEIFLAFFTYRSQRSSLFHEVDGASIPDSAQFKTLRKLLGRYRTVAGTDYVYHSCDGALAIAEGNLAHAERAFAAVAASLPIDGALPWLTRGANTFRNPWAMTSELFAPISGQFAVRAEIHSFGQIVLANPTMVFSTDASYFERFAPDACDSLIRSGFIGNLVIACANLERFNDDTLRAVTTRATDSGVGVRVLGYPFDGRDLATFSALLRYVVGRELLDEGFAHVHISDIDFAFTPDIWSAFETRRLDNRLAFALSWVPRGRALIPWFALNAGASLFKQNQPSKQFLTFVQRYIEAVFDPSADNWLLGQNGLYAAWQISQRTIAHSTVGSVADARIAGTAWTKETGVIRFRQQTRNANQADRLQTGAI